MRADQQPAVSAIELRDLIRSDDASGTAQRRVRIVIGLRFVLVESSRQSRPDGAADVDPQRLRVLAERGAEDGWRGRSRAAACRRRRSRYASHLHAAAAALVIHPELRAFGGNDVLV